MKKQKLKVGMKEKSVKYQGFHWTSFIPNLFASPRSQKGNKSFPV